MRAQEPVGSTENANLAGLIDALQSIDTTKALAKLNRTSIADNNGSRIKL
jgi:hypothetical protein